MSKIFDDKYKQAVIYLQKYKNYSEFEDIKQTVAIKLLENEDSDVVSVCNSVVKDFTKDYNKRAMQHAKSLYNEDGECLDDDIYFVDQSTVEQFGETNNITDEIKEYVGKLEKTLQAIDFIYGGNTFGEHAIRLKKVKGRKQANDKIKSLVNFKKQRKYYNKQCNNIYIYQ